MSLFSGNYPYAGDCGCHQASYPGVAVDIVLTFWSRPASAMSPPFIMWLDDIDPYINLNEVFRPWSPRPSFQGLVNSGPSASIIRIAPWLNKDRADRQAGRPRPILTASWPLGLERARFPPGFHQSFISEEASRKPWRSGKNTGIKCQDFTGGCFQDFRLTKRYNRWIDYRHYRSYG
jgi:hypothetical protein